MREANIAKASCVNECLQIHPMYAEPQFSTPKRSNTLPSYAQVESPNAHHKRDDSFPMVDFDPRKQANEENGLRPSRPTPDRKPSRPFYDQDGVSLPLRQSLQSATLFGMSPSLQAKLDKPSAWLGQSLAHLSDYRSCEEQSTTFCSIFPLHCTTSSFCRSINALCQAELIFALLASSFLFHGHLVSGQMLGFQLMADTGRRAFTAGS